MGIRVAVAAFVVLSAAVGCGGGDPSPTTVPTVTSSSVSPSPSPSSSPSATPTPTASPPTLPALARQDSPAGAQSFARFWLTTLDYAYKTGDTSPFLALGECKSCQSIATGIQQFYAADGHFEGGTFTAQSSQTARHVKSSAALVDLVYSRQTGRAIPGNGTPKTVPAEKDTELLLTLSRSTTGWRLTVLKTVTRK